MKDFWLMILLIIIPFAMYYIDQAGDAAHRAELMAKERAEREVEHARQEAERVRVAARQTYQAALKVLRQKPRDPEIYQCARDAGHAYAALTTAFDERTLQDDLHAATSIDERLAQLETLRKQGLVANIEYYQRRHKILNEV